MHDGKASTVQYRANGLAIHVLTKGRTDLGPPEFSESGPKQDSAQVKNLKRAQKRRAELLKRNQPIELI